jgi:hypothetical protein
MFPGFDRGKTLSLDGRHNEEKGRRIVRECVGGS